MTERLLRTAFFTSLFAYIFFALADYGEPGLVSDTFSVHLWVLPIVVCGIGWARVTTRTPSLGRGTQCIAVFLGILLGVLVWREGEVFGGLRLLLAFAAAVLPWSAQRVLSKASR